jgi:hypothetical protein
MDGENRLRIHYWKLSIKYMAIDTSSRNKKAAGSLQRPLRFHVIGE